MQIFNLNGTSKENKLPHFLVFADIQIRAGIVPQDQVQYKYDQNKN